MMDLRKFYISARIDIEATTHHREMRVTYRFYFQVRRI
jgi:hypothetical protein